jgi:hypothetical protein
VEDLKQLYEVREKVLSNLANTQTANTPVFQDHPQPAPDVVHLKQLLMKLIDDEYCSAERHSKGRGVIGEEVEISGILKYFTRAAPFVTIRK